MASDGLTLGELTNSDKEHERRAPIHPEHLERIPAELGERIYLERGQGERFGWRDSALEVLVAGLLDREALFARRDIRLIAKPVAQDFSSFRDGPIHWGWPHCVQDPAIPQSAIDQRLTWIPWEEMHHWKEGTWQGHVFHLNNELAGYGRVRHALGLQGLTAHSGPQRNAAVLGFGSEGRGALHGLPALGYRDVTCSPGARGSAVACPVPAVKHGQVMGVGEDSTQVVMAEDRRMPMAAAIGHFDIVVNATLQDTDNPMKSLRTDELDALRPGTLRIDMSCDEGMGFELGRPTSLTDPTCTVGDEGVTYDAVDHSPSHLWLSATHAIGRALPPFQADVMAGPTGWAANETVEKAIDIREGVIQHSRSRRFQGRSETCPHPVTGGSTDDG